MKISKNIVVDLHIHSRLSAYKEPKGYVDESNVENIDVLLDNLLNNKVNLFAITDHNRFDYNLYSKLVEKTTTGDKYKSHLSVLPGVEFDVKFDGGKEHCHIIAIFDNSDESRIQEIDSAIFEIRDSFLSKDEYYKEKELSDFFSKLGINVVLIAHQQTGILYKKPNERDLSSSMQNTEEFLKTGVIDALEIKQLKNEISVKNSLEKSEIDIATILGSDCHVWKHYPNNFAQEKKPSHFSHIKMLPTFKGLKYAFTSIETRFNRYTGNNKGYVKSVTLPYIMDELGTPKKIELSKNINVIIGNNGSGKSYLVNTINNPKTVKKGIYSKFSERNPLIVEKDKSSRIEYVKQGKIISDFKKDKQNFEFGKVGSIERFRQLITSYTTDISDYVTTLISQEEDILDMKESFLDLRPIEEYSRTIPILDILSTELSNKYTNRYKKIQRIRTDLEIELNDSIYKEFNTEVMELKKSFDKLLDSLKKSMDNTEFKNSILNVIINSMNIYDASLEKVKSTIQKDEESRDNNNNEEINKILSLYSQKLKSEKFPVFPNPVNGLSERKDSGYKFIQTAKFHNIDLKVDYFKYFFNKDYQTEKQIMGIQSKEELSSAIKSVSTFEEMITSRLDSFIEDYSTINESIIEMTDGSEQVTPGQKALISYKYIFDKNSPSKTIIIDQPEDDINPRAIYKYLVQAITKNKDKKQIILVTHNPMLVVNLDADNVIYVKNINNILDLEYGSLEYEEDKYTISDIIEKNLDGGKKALEKRLKVYGKNIDKDS